MSFGGLSKLDVYPNECVVWDGNQIGVFEDSNSILLCLTVEDFENGEFSDTERADVLRNEQAIRAALTAKYSVVN